MDAAFCCRHFPSPWENVWFCKENAQDSNALIISPFCTWADQFVRLVFVI